MRHWFENVFLVSNIQIYVRSTHSRDEDDIKDIAPSQVAINCSLMKDETD